MASYAAVISLKQTIKHLGKDLLLLPDSETEHIYQDLSFLESFLQTIDSWRSSNRERASVLECKIRDATHKFEDLIKTPISDRFLSSSEPDSSRVDEALTLVLSQSLLTIKQELGSIVETLKSEEATSEEQDDQSRFIVSSGIGSSGGTTIQMVGMDDTLKKLQRRVYHGQRKRIVFAIVGMVGIGKTAIAKQVYYGALATSDFYLRLFVPMGPQFQLKTLLLIVLRQLGVPIDGIRNNSDGDLGLMLYQQLFRRRYFIVLDNVWNSYEYIKFFPENDNGSRIILTTRLEEVARNACGNKDNILQVPFLNDDDSWELLQKTVFTIGESCDSDLQKIGRKIAKNCEGLPLAIIEVGKLLRGMEKTVESWKSVEEDDNPLNIRADDDTPISKTLSLSYDHLPVHLKACFLYMGVFPKKYEIHLSKLIKLWFSEGLIEPHNGRSLEETAEEYLADLVSNNIVLVGERRSTQGIKTCGVHIFYRILCVSKAWNEKFFHVINKYAHREGIESQRRLCFHNKTVLGFKQVQSSMDLVSGVHSLVIFGEEDQRPLWLYLPFRLLRVLDALTIRFFIFPRQVLDQVHLRYLSIKYNGEIPASISRLWNLEVFIVHPQYHLIQLSSKNSSTVYYLPIEIWKLNKLRHLDCMGFDLPDPSRDENDSVIILENLLTLSGVSAHSCTREVLSRTPNLIKLGIRIVSALSEAVETFSFNGDVAELCGRIESLKCVVVNPPDPSASQVVVTSIPLAFPVNITKITLSGCGFPWESMAHIGSLPNLKVLKLLCDAFRGPEWKTTKWEFPLLEFLLLEDLDIQQWTGYDDSQFRKLSRLIVRHCYRLLEIPPEIGYIDSVEVDDCSPSTYQGLQDDLESHGIESLLHIHSSLDSTKPKSFTGLGSKATDIRKGKH